MIRHLRRAAWILVVLVLLGVLLWTGANLVGSWRYQAAVRTLTEDGFVLQPHAVAPEAVPAAQNAAPYYSAAFALYVEPPQDADWETKPTRELDPGQRAAAEGWLGRNTEAFDMVRRAQKRARCRFERDYSLGYSMPLPEIAKVLGLARGFHRLAETQVLAGDGAAARESVRLMLALAECLRDDPILVSQLVRMTVAETALLAVENAVTDATGADDLREWQVLLPSESPLKGCLERAYRGEIAMASSLLDAPSSESWTLLAGVNGTGWTLIRPLVKYDGGGYLLDMRRMVLACRKPYLDASADVTDLNPHSMWSPVRSMLLPALTTCLKRQATVDARLIVLRAGLEAERALKTTGAYPKSIPGVDPFSGKPLIYDLEKGRIASVRPTEGTEDRPTEWRLRATK